MICFRWFNSVRRTTNPPASGRRGNSAIRRTTRPHVETLEERTLFSGDLVEYGATPYAGDAHFKDWPETLQKLRDLKPLALVPGRGDALAGEDAVEEGIAGTQAFLGELYKAVSQSAEAGESLKQAYEKAMAALQPRYGNWVIFEHCLPFDVSRAYDEAKGLDHPRIWTAERDLEMWTALEKAD